MGTGQSKTNSPPETPQYMKYGGLHNVVDPRSPTEHQRTPIVYPKQEFDPRSPSVDLTRTPIFAIPDTTESEREPIIFNISVTDDEEQASKCDGRMQDHIEESTENGTEESLAEKVSAIKLDCSEIGKENVGLSASPILKEKKKTQKELYKPVLKKAFGESWNCTPPQQPLAESTMIQRKSEKDSVHDHRLESPLARHRRRDEKSHTVRHLLR